VGTANACTIGTQSAVFDMMPPAHDSRPHLVIFAHSSDAGGAEHCLDTTLRHLDFGRWRVTVVFSREGPMAEAARRAGAAVEIRTHLWWMMRTRHSWHGPRTPLRWLALARWLRAQRADLVYTNTAVIPDGAFAAWLARIPHVWHVHEVLTPHHTAPNLLPVRASARLIGWLSDRVVFESVAARRICERAIPEVKSRVVSNSLRVLPQGAPVPRAEARAMLDVDEGDFLVAWIGAFSKRKRPTMLVEAMARMAHAARTTLLFVGAGPLESAMHRAAHRLDIDPSRCRVIPFQDDITVMLRASDALALTSEEESFGLVLIEASAFGLPVVATASQGPTEIIRDGETGFLVGVDDVAMLAQRLDTLAADADLRARLGEAGSARVAAEYCPVRNTAGLEKVLAEVLGAA
jgi:glycosyltransferase involved in cell wall biosynthesis